MSILTRRELLVSSAAGAAALALAPATALSAATPREPVLRFAHLTDIHVKPEGEIPDGMAKALRHAQAQSGKIDFILQGGDAIMDALKVDFDRTKAQFDLWNRILADECKLPVEHVIGNHDIFGWDKAKSKATGAEPQYGKKWAMEMFQLEKPYRSFDRGGWHFVILDSVQQPAEGKTGTYVAGIDDEQFEWLAGDLAATPATTPIIVASHIPILSVTPFLFSTAEGTNKQWKVLEILMIADAKRIKDLFAKHPNVKVCLSGHCHLVDRVDYNGVTYFCNGAVSGNWWAGPFQECKPGYATINLYADGGFEREYVEWG